MEKAGKTTFSGRLAKVLNCVHVEIDNHLDKQKGEYVAYINCDTLVSATQVNGGSVIVEGVCLLSVARKCHLHLDEHIYIRRVGSGGWYEADLCLATKSLDELVAEDLQLRESVARMDGDTSGQTVHPLFKEQAEYHRDQKPLEKASMLFDLHENTLGAWKDEAGM